MSKKSNYELFVKSNYINNNQKTKPNTVNINLTESITSIENLSDTSQSEQTEFLTNSILFQLSRKIKRID